MGLQAAAPAAKPIASLPVTVDEEDIDLVLYEGQKPEDAVSEFCAKHMPSAGEACNDQLLPHVQRKLAAASEEGLLEKD